MSIVYLETATCYFQDTNTRKTFSSLDKAIEAAEIYVGNKSYAKPFLTEDTRFYGPGNGDTTVVVRRDLDMSAFMGRTK